MKLQLQAQNVCPSSHSPNIANCVPSWSFYRADSGKTSFDILQSFTGKKILKKGLKSLENKSIEIADVP